VYESRPDSAKPRADAVAFEQFPRIRKRPHGPYQTGKCGETPPAELLAGIAEFNQGLFFEQHETLELLWRRESDDVRYLYQGILLVGVGCYHLLRGNANGARIKLERGIEILGWFEAVCQRVDVARLRRDSQRCLAALQALAPDQLLAFDRRMLPRVHLVDESEDQCGVDITPPGSDSD